MLRHRNVKTEEPQNQGIFIGNMNFSSQHRNVEPVMSSEQRPEVKTVM